MNSYSRRRASDWISHESCYEVLETFWRISWKFALAAKYLVWTSMRYEKSHWFWTLSATERVRVFFSLCLTQDTNTSSRFKILLGRTPYGVWSPISVKYFAVQRHLLKIVIASTTLCSTVITLKVSTMSTRTKCTQQMLKMFRVLIRPQTLSCRKYSILRYKSSPSSSVRALGTISAILSRASKTWRSSRPQLTHT